MATTIVTKYGSDAPATTDIVRGELAVDTENGRLYTENAAGAVVEIGLKPEANVDVTGTITATGTSVFASLDISGDIDVDGTTNLDVVDIDGAVDFASTTAHAGNATFADNAKAIFGADSDLQIYHDGSNSYINDNGTGDLRIRAANLHFADADGTTSFYAFADGAVNLYNDGDLKLATTATGIDVTGTATMDGLTVEGASSVAQAQNTTLGTNVGLVVGTIGAAGGVGDLNQIGFHYNPSGSIPASIISSILTSTTGYTKSDLLFSTRDVTTPTAPTERMRIDSSGNVGIGTTSPSSLLHIRNTGSTEVLAQSTSANAASSGRFVAKEADAAGYGAGFRYDGDLNTASIFGITTNNDNDVITWSRGGSDIQFKTSGAERMRIDSSGNLLIGKTSTPLGTAGVVAYGGTSAGVIALTNEARPLYINKLTSDGSIIEIAKDGTTVGSIGVNYSDITYICDNNNSGLAFDGTATRIFPCDSDGTTSDADTDLGSSGVRFKDLYLSGGINNGTNAIAFSGGAFAGDGSANDAAIDLGRTNRRFQNLFLSSGVYLGGAAAANKLDDYEEGTFTPVMENVTGWSGASGVSGTYTKIGNTVHVFISMTSNVALTGTPTNKITGLPFSSNLGEQCSNVSISRMFGVHLTTTDYIAGVGDSNIIFMSVNGDNTANNLTHSGTTLRFTLSATYTTAS